MKDSTRGNKSKERAEIIEKLNMYYPHGYIQKVISKLSDFPEITDYMIRNYFSGKGCSQAAVIERAAENLILEGKKSEAERIKKVDQIFGRTRNTIS